MNNIKYCDFDVETTGLLEESKAEVIEFGCKFLDINLNIVKSYKTLIKPNNIDLDKPLPDWSLGAFKVNKIDTEELKTAPKSSEVVPIIIGMFMEAGKPILVGHNIINFDIPMMERLFNQNGKNFLQFIGRPIIDTYSLSYVVVGNKVTNFKQSTLAKFFDIKISGDSHRVDYDTYENTALFKKLSSIVVNIKEESNSDVKDASNDVKSEPNAIKQSGKGGKKHRCPSCGTGYFVLRENKKKGTQFYGCSNFPQCRMSCEIYNVKKYPVMT